MGKDTTVAIRGDDKHLTGVLNNAKQKLKKFGTSVRNGANAFGKYSAAAVTAMTVATAAIYKAQSQQIDALAKTSDSLGINIEKLQALSHLYELNGGKAEGLTKGLTRMEKSLGEAARRGGTMADALEDAGVNLNSIIKLSPDKQMQVLAEALSRVDNQAVKASIASDLFGREGVKMLKLMKTLAAEGIDPTVKSLEEMGATIDRVDAAQVEAANDAFLEAQKVIRGAAQVLTVKLAPYVKLVSDRLVEAAKQSGGFGAQIDNAFKTGLRAAGKFSDILHGLRVAIKGVELIVVGFKGAAISAFQLIAEIWTAQVSAIVKSLNFLIGGLNRIGADIDELPDPSDSSFMKGLRKFASNARDDVGRVRGELHDLAMQEMPSDKVEKFLTDVSEKAKEAARQVAKVSSGDDGDESDDPVVADEVTARRLKKIQDSLKTEKELLADKLKEDTEAIAAAKAQQLINDEEAKKLEVELAEAHAKKLTEIDKKASDKQAQIAKTAADLRYNAVRSSLQNLSTLMNSENRKMFEIGKAAAIGDTIISTIKAAQDSYSSLAGIPIVGPALGIAAAAAATLAGMGRVAAIRSQQFGGGGAGALATGSNTQAVNASSTPVGGGSGGGLGGESVLTIQGLDPGSIFNGEQVRTLTDAINTHVSRGGKLRVA